MDNNIENKSEYILDIHNVSKTFPGVKALSNIDLNLKRGEVLALLGENGAGKSTLMKILAGVYTPDKGYGHIKVDAREVFYSNPNEAKDDGVVMIFQELSLVPDLSVAENIFLGSMPKKAKGIVDWKKLNANAQAVLDAIGCNINPKSIVRTLPIAEQQLVEICRAMAYGAKIVVFDEPTSSLTDKEKQALFRNIQKLKEQQVGIVYISHKMDEIFEISDRITVFCDGVNRGTLATKDTDLAEVTKLMIGRNLDEYYHKSGVQPGKEILRVEDLTSKDTFKDISFSVREGEVVGLYGLVGAGRSEIVETIFGIRKKTGGSIYFENEPVKINSSRDAVKSGIGLVPEDRKHQGLILEMSCMDNIALAKLPSNANKIGIVDKKKHIQIYAEYKEKLGIASPSPLQKVVFLSGGNQQKVVIGKWMSTNPKLLILDEPTRGIDVGSKAEIHKLIAQFAESGGAVLVISSEMPEIIGISNRIIVIKDGRAVAEYSESEMSEESLIYAVTQYEACAQ